MTRPYTKSNRYQGICACGQHAWAVLTKGFVTFVDPEDAHLLQERKWCAVLNGNLIYAESASSEFRKLHRAILNDSRAVDIDHIDYNGTNNRRSNLRPATHAQNMGHGRYEGAASGFRGVYFHQKKTARWRTYIAGRYVGTFDTPEAAARAYDAAALARYGEFATLNFSRGEVRP